MNCPSFRVDLRSGGDVDLFCNSGCAIPGDYHYRVPKAAFSGLLREFETARFFSTPRLDPRYAPTDKLVKRLAYRDDKKVHEVVDMGRPLPAISSLEKTFREVAQVDTYLTPSVELYKGLIQSGWNVNTLGEDHENALAAAVHANDAASVALLLEHGATVSDGALRAAVYAKSIDIFRQLAIAKRLDYGSDEGGQLLITAAQAGKAAIVGQLLESGAPVNYRQPQSSETALLAAGSRTAIARLLIEHGADVNAQDQTGKTPLFRAAFAPNTDIIDLLTAHGADPNIADNTGRTPLMSASDVCAYWSIQAFLKHGANPSIRDEHGRTALLPNYAALADPKCGISKQLLNEAIARPR